MRKKCDWCKKEMINIQSPKRRFCDDVCRSAFRRSQANETGTYLVVCKTCGKEFRTYHDTKKFCSIDCRKTKTVNHEAIRKKIRYKVACGVCGKEVISSNSFQKFCSYKCKTKSRNAMNEMKKRKYRRDGDSSINLNKLIIKYKNICYLCGDECDKEDYVIDEKGTTICGGDYPSIEHIIPLSKGGHHEWSNVNLAHRKCNIEKSNKTKENLA